MLLKHRCLYGSLLHFYPQWPAWSAVCVQTSHALLPRAIFYRDILVASVCFVESVQQRKYIQSITYDRSFALAYHCLKSKEKTLFRTLLVPHCFDLISSGLISPPTQMSVERKPFNRDEQTYTRCYCEENIYMMCKNIATNDPELLEKSTVIFISNPNKTVSLRAPHSMNCIVEINDIVTRFQCGNRKEWMMMECQ